MRYTTLISAADLAQHVLEPDWIVLDCRHDLADLEAGRTAFEAGHIPGAQFAYLEHELSGCKIGAQRTFRGRHPLPEREVFIEALRRWGINDDSQVVAYDAHGGMFAARLWWMLRWAGHAAAAVLDGGLSAWTGHGMWLSTELGGKARGNIALQPSLVTTVDADEVLANLTQPAQSAQSARTLIDARAADRFRGENETLDPVGGHIPGAKNRFFKNNLQSNGHFKYPQQLREEWGSLLPSAASCAIMQCGSGVTACHHLLALEVAGMPGAALYPGSWSEWCADSTRPVATGEGSEPSC